MSAATKRHPIDKELVTLTLTVHRDNVLKIKEYVQSIEEDADRTYSVAEVFPEFLGKEPEIALRAYRTRENLTQKQLAAATGIPQRHLSEMENGRRGIGKERAKKLAEALNVSDYRFFL